MTWSNKKGLIGYLQVLRYDGCKFLKCCSLPMKAAVCIRFLYYLNHAASYLQYHLEYKKPATKFPAILDSFLTEVHCGSTISGEPHHGWRWGGGRAVQLTLKLIKSHRIIFSTTQYKLQFCRQFSYSTFKASSKQPVQQEFRHFS